jgi:cobalamin biosynthesis Mg chelatase CobN
LTSGITFLAGLASANLFARQATDPCESIAACASINNAVNACTDDACFCPTALAVAAACASCYATVNATLSADLSSAIVQCQTEGYSAGEAVPTTATAPAATGANATAAGGANSLAVQTSDAGATGTTGSDDPGATGNSSPDSGDSGDATGGSGNTASATKSASNSKSSSAASHDVFGFSFGVLLVVLVASVLTLFG